MANSDSNKAAGAGDFYGAISAPEGLVARRAPAQSYDGDIQLNIADLERKSMDDGITGLRKQVQQQQAESEEIGTEARVQNKLVNQLKQTAIKAEAGLKNNMRRMNQRIVQDASNHVMHAVLFGVVCFLVIYLWCKSGGQASKFFW